MRQYEHTREMHGNLLILKDGCGNIIWNQKMDDIIRKGLEAGMSHGGIAKAMGLTRETVIGRAWRLRKSGKLPKTLGAKK